MIERWTKEWIDIWNEGRDYERDEALDDMKYMVLQATVDGVIDRYQYKELIERLKVWELKEVEK